MTPVLFVVQF